MSDCADINGCNITANNSSGDLHHSVKPPHGVLTILLCVLGGVVLVGIALLILRVIYIYKLLSRRTLQRRASFSTPSNSKNPFARLFLNSGRDRERVQAIRNQRMSVSFPPRPALRHSRSENVNRQATENIGNY